MPETSVLEQEAGTEQQAEQTTNEAEASPLAGEQVATGEADGSENPENKAEKPVEFEELTEEEFQSRVDAKANSIAALSTATYQRKVQSLETQINKLNDERAAEKEEAELAKLEGAELEQLGDTPEVRSIQQQRRELTQREKKITSEIAAVLPRLDAADDYQLAEEILADPVFEARKKTLTPLLEEIAKGKTPEEKRIRAENFVLKQKVATPREPKGAKPAPRGTGGGGGEDLSKLPLGQRMVRALEISDRRKQS